MCDVCELEATLGFVEFNIKTIFIETSSIESNIFDDIIKTKIYLNLKSEIQYIVNI